MVLRASMRALLKRLPRLNLVEPTQEPYVSERQLVRRIIGTYSGLVRWYSIARFQIMRLRFLEEMVQHLPESGTILDLGCGFGLFSLYMAARRPAARIVGVDLDERRLALARRSAEALGLRNVSFEAGDLRDWRPSERLHAAYALDVLHHIPVAAGDALLGAVHARLEPSGVFLLKDIDTRPRAMMLFTYVLDLLMAPKDVFSYRSVAAWRALLRQTGFAQLHVHYLWDVLPYPHVLLICRKPAAPAADEAPR